VVVFVLDGVSGVDADGGEDANAEDWQL